MQEVQQLRACRTLHTRACAAGRVRAPLLTRVAATPAARAIWPPRPGYSSTLWIVVATGMLESGMLLPGLMAPARPAVTSSPAQTLWGARM